MGSQCRSAVFYANADQQKIASAYIQKIIDARNLSKPVVTQMVPLKQFYRAEDHQQNYLALHPNQPCIVFNNLPKLAYLRQQFPFLYK